MCAIGRNTRSSLLLSMPHNATLTPLPRLLIQRHSKGASERKTEPFSVLGHSRRTYVVPRRSETPPLPRPSCLAGHQAPGSQNGRTRRGPWHVTERRTPGTRAAGGSFPVPYGFLDEAVCRDRDRHCHRRKAEEIGLHIHWPPPEVAQRIDGHLAPLAVRRLGRAVDTNPTANHPTETEACLAICCVEAQEASHLGRTGLCKSEDEYGLSPSSQTT